LKIHNSTKYRSKTLRETKYIARNLYGKIEGLGNFKLKMYLPKIYCPAVVYFTGHYQAGGIRSRREGYSEGEYYPALFMRAYHVDSHFSITKKKKDEINKVFNDNGIKLHDDTWSGRQLGLDKNKNIIILDIQTKTGEKFL
jgi:hypothetical protein